MLVLDQHFALTSEHPRARQANRGCGREVILRLGRLDQTQAVRLYLPRQIHVHRLKVVPLRRQKRALGGDPHLREHGFALPSFHSRSCPWFQKNVTVGEPGTLREVASLNPTHPPLAARSGRVWSRTRRRYLHRHRPIRVLSRESGADRAVRRRSHQATLGVALVRARTRRTRDAQRERNYHGATLRTSTWSATLEWTQLKHEATERTHQGSTKIRGVKVADGACLGRAGGAQGSQALLGAIPATAASRGT